MRVAIRRVFGVTPVNAAALVVLVMGSAPTGACAAEPGVLADRIEAELTAEAGHERVWWNAWTAGYGGLTVGESVSAGLTGSGHERVDMGVGAATSLIGLVGMLISPMPEVTSAARTLAAMPAGTLDERRARDDVAVRLRADAAGAEAEGRTWLAHALNLAVAGGSSLVLWKGFDRGTSAATNFGSSVAIGELQIWTQPARLLHGIPDETPPAGTTASLGWAGRLFYVRVAF